MGWIVLCGVVVLDVLGFVFVCVLEGLAERITRLEAIVHDADRARRSASGDADIQP